MIISLKPSQIFAEAETKTNRHFPANINQQEATRAVIVFGLVKKDGAGRLEIQILCYEESSTDVRALTGKREKGGLDQEEPLGGVVEECLASQLT